tara:strand:+ start:1396 stop:1596 length:201 start_codon:yes stop_codon:yes gene_type:complete
MNYRAVCFELLAERSTLKAKNKMLLAATTHALEDLQALQTGQCTIDEISGVLIELRCAITKAKGGE